MRVTYISSYSTTPFVHIPCLKSLLRERLIINPRLIQHEKMYWTFEYININMEKVVRPLGEPTNKEE